jgi:hypothetical protein
VLAEHTSSKRAEDFEGYVSSSRNKQISPLTAVTFSDICV